VTDDDITLLLRRADASAPPSELDERRLSQSIRCRAARRALTRRASAASLSTLVLLALLIFTHRPAAHPVIAPTVNVAQLKAELALLDSEARFYERTARAVEEAQSSAIRRVTDNRTVATDSIDRVQQEREAAAAILIHQAQRLALGAETQAAARSEYQTTVDLFPDTAAGRQAQAFLREGI